jgi:NTE family protein
MKPLTVGIALGGGGARGGIHIGVLKVLEEAGIECKVVTGTSVGALIGAQYVLCPHAAILEDRLNEYLTSDVFKKSHFKLMESALKKNNCGFIGRVSQFIRQEYVLVKAAKDPSVMPEEEFSDTIAFFVAEEDIDSAELRFGAVATDLDSGREVVISSGPLRKAVLASCALPGIIPPVKYNGYRLIDGFCTSKVPIRAARELGADFVIAVDIEQDIEKRCRAENTIEIIIQAQKILSTNLTRAYSRAADFIIAPNTIDIEWLDVPEATRLVAVGEEVARSRLDDLQRMIAKKKRETLFARMWR